MRLVAILILSALAAGAQSTPQSIVEAFFSSNGIRNKREVYTGEMLSFLNERTLGQQLGKKAAKQIRLLQSSETEAAFAIEITSDSTTQDWYAFVQRSGNMWKLSAIRSLALDGLRTDAQTREYLRAHLAEFDALAAQPTDAARMRALQLTEVNVKPDGSIECIAAKALRKAAGYLYVPEGASPPAMNAFATMYIEPVVGRWYVFKTN